MPVCPRAHSINVVFLSEHPRTTAQPSSATKTNTCQPTLVLGTTLDLIRLHPTHPPACNPRYRRQPSILEAEQEQHMDLLLNETFSLHTSPPTCLSTPTAAGSVVAWTWSWSSQWTCSSSTPSTCMASSSESWPSTPGKFGATLRCTTLWWMGRWVCLLSFSGVVLTFSRFELVGAHVRLRGWYGSWLGNCFQYRLAVS
jgi:hypothetical protein